MWCSKYDQMSLNNKRKRLLYAFYVVFQVLASLSVQEWWRSLTNNFRGWPKEQNKRWSKNETRKKKKRSDFLSHFLLHFCFPLLHFLIFSFLKISVVPERIRTPELGKRCKKHREGVCFIYFGWLGRILNITCWWDD